MTLRELARRLERKYPGGVEIDARHIRVRSECLVVWKSGKSGWKFDAALLEDTGKSFLDLTELALVLELDHE